MTITIRDATQADAGTIVAFNAAMAMETESKRLDTETLAAGVAAALADSGRARYWIAEHAGAAIGQVMVTQEWSDWRNAWFWWLQSVYVVPEQRRRGAFRSLYARVQDEARAAGACGLRLYVERENRTAADTYRALGMRDADYAMLECVFETTDGETPC